MSLLLVKISQALGLVASTLSTLYLERRWYADSSLDAGSCSDTATYATPHVAGLVAYLIGTRGNMSPATMSALIKSTSIKSAISGLREYSNPF